LGRASAPMIEPLPVTNAFGVRCYGSIGGLVVMLSFGGAALFDRTGSYRLAFVLDAAGFAAAGVLFALMAASMRGRGYRVAAARAGMR